MYFTFATSSNCNRIDIVFDRYITPSIKNYPRDLRSDGKASSPYVISGPQQKRPGDFIKALRNDFKTALIHHFVESWNDGALAHILGLENNFRNL